MQERDLKAQLFPWQHASMHALFVSFPRCITGTKIQLQCPSISRDTLDFVICLHTVTSCDVITSPFNLHVSLREILQERKHEPLF